MPSSPGKKDVRIRLGAEVLQDGQNPAVISAGGRQVELEEDVRDVLLHRARAHLELGHDAGVGLALGHQLQHLLLARGEPVQRVVAAADEPVPQQDRIFGDHDSHGSSAVMTVGPPNGLSMLSVPSTAAARCSRPRRPVCDAPSRLPGAAPPRPLSVTVMRSTSRARVTATPAWVAWACLATLASASETMK